MTSDDHEFGVKRSCLSQRFENGDKIAWRSTNRIDRIDDTGKRNIRRKQEGARWLLIDRDLAVIGDDGSAARNIHI
jgi:hypothetical protein